MSDANSNAGYMPNAAHGVYVGAYSSPPSWLAETVWLVTV